MHNTEIFVWPDGSWLRKKDYEDASDSWRGDDFRTIAVPEVAFYDDEIIEDLISQLVL